MSRNVAAFSCCTKKLLKRKETSKLKTETFLLLKEVFIWSKIYRVVHHSVNMGVVETKVGNFPERSNFSGNFEQLVDRANVYSFFQDCFKYNTNIFQRDREFSDMLVAYICRRIFHPPPSIYASSLYCMFFIRNLAQGLVLNNS